MLHQVRVQVWFALLLVCCISSRIKSCFSESTSSGKTESVLDSDFADVDDIKTLESLTDTFLGDDFDLSEVDSHLSGPYSSDFVDSDFYSYDQSWDRGQMGRKRTLAKVISVFCPHKARERKRGQNGLVLFFHKKRREMHINQGSNVMWNARDVEALVENGFDVKKRTLIYFHGWKNDNQAKYLLKAREYNDLIADANGGEPTYNLLIFDWNAFSSFNYGISSAYVPYIAKVIANLIEQLIDRHGFKAELVDIVSYSLSTHIAGLVGRQLQRDHYGLVRQITAIDPTGLCFHNHRENKFDIEYSLRATDAKLVVARHYNINEFGAGRPIGGVDVILNDGKKQPMKKVEKYKFKNLLKVGLMHYRGSRHEEFSFDLNSDCHEIAYECSSAKKFRLGHCADCGARNDSCLFISTVGNVFFNQDPSEMHFRKNTKMYTITGASQFCTYNYQVVAVLKPEASEYQIKYFEKGKFEFEVGEDVSVRPKYRLSDSRHIIFTRLLRENRKISSFPERIPMEPSQYQAMKALESISINFMSNISPNVRKKHSARYCPDFARGPQLVLC